MSLNFKKIPKINTIDYGGKWIGLGLIFAVVIPGIIWVIFHVFLWWICVIGIVIFVAFLVWFCIEMWQDNSNIPYYERTLKEKIPYDPEKQYAVIRVSVCTGEKMAGFKNYEDGHFMEVMLIRDAEDERRFMKIYGLDKIKIQY
ncbi:MAG: hypothetical protein ACI4EK_02750 [Wujia sp.]